MTLRRSTKRNPLITPTQPPPPPLPPPQYKPAALQAVVSAAVVATLAQFSMSDNSRGGTTIHSTQGDALVCSRECSYKDFTNCKPIFFNGTGGIIALS